MGVIEKIESFKIPEVNRLLDKMFTSNNLDRRMEICNRILTELEYSGIDIDDIEDDLKEICIN